MAVETQRTSDVADNLQAQLQAQLSQNTPLLPKSFIRVLSRVMGGVYSLLFKYAGWVLLQQNPETADFQPSTINGVTFSPLIALGQLVGVGDPLPGAAAELRLGVTVLQQGGALPANTQLINSATGVTYVTTEAVLLDAAVVQVRVRAVSDQDGGGGVGVIGNLNTGDELTFSNPIAAVDRTATVQITFVTGANPETEPVYRARVLDRFRNRPQGGAGIDYVIWSTSVPGIINAFPYTSEIPGGVDVFIEATAASSGNAGGIPTAAQLTQVEDAIAFNENGIASRRPASAFVSVLPISRVAFDVNIFGLNVSDRATVIQQINTAMENLFAEFEPFVTGVSPSPRRDLISSTAVIGEIEDIVTAANGLFNAATVTLTTDPTNNIDLFVLDQGVKAELNIVNFR